jgi:transposase-like protein
MSKRPKRMHEVQRTKEETAVGERREDRQPEGESVVRGRPGRRTVEERQQAVLDLFAGKASVDQLARRLGVLPATVEGWRQDALAGVAEALRRGSGKTDRERELERTVERLRHVVTETAIEKELWKAAAEKERQSRPTVPGRSWP